jgi:DNA-binding response OmpR family regulator
MPDREPKPRVLIVEDERGSSDNLSWMFEAHGWRPVVVPHGETAQQLLCESGPFDIVLVDLEIPGPSGVEVIRHARDCEVGRRDGARARVVIYTAYSPSDPSVSEALAAGADALLLKPTLFSRVLAVAADGDPGDEPHEAHG